MMKTDRRRVRKDQRNRFDCSGSHQGYGRDQSAGESDIIDAVQALADKALLPQLTRAPAALPYM